MTLTKADHKKRSNGIGSSEIAMLIYLPDKHGDPKPLSPWGGRHLLWRRKTNKEPPADEKQYMTRGKFMETGLIDWYAHDHNVAWGKPPTMRHPDHQYVVDSCDGLTYPKGTTKPSMRTGKLVPLRAVEAKTSSWWKRDEWGEAGTDEIPFYYLVQCQWHLGCHETQEQICDVPMDNGSQRADYHVAFDAELYGQLVEQANRFWVDYVKADKEPPVDDYSDATTWLSRWMKNKDGMGVLEANEEQIKLLLQYQSLALRLEKGKGSLLELKEKLQREIGEYDGIVIPDTKQRILWKQSKDSVSPDWKKIAEHIIEEHKVDPTTVGALQGAYTKTRKGSRKWTPTALLKQHASKEE